MALSLAEPVELVCPRCSLEFSASVWLIVDAAERRDLEAQILDATLHDTRCPHCAATGRTSAPLLYHNRHARRVLFGVPAGMDEDEWRAVAEGLLWTLVGALPETQRAPYLGELQAEAGLEGVATVIRAEKLAELELEAEMPPIVIAIQDLLAAQGPDALRRALERHPILHGPEAIAILRELASEALKQGEDEAGAGFARAAEILHDLAHVEPPAGRPAPGAPPAEDPLDEIAFTLLRSHTGEMLADAVDRFPQLLDPTIDIALHAWSERARAEGKRRLAHGMDERRAALQTMRAHYVAEQPVYDAVQALLQAVTAAEVEQVLVEYDALYSDTADAVLARLQLTSDPDLAALAGDRRDLLRSVRDALRTPSRDGTPPA